MKSFKSIREGKYVEPGVSQIDDAPEDPLSFVEIKPKKTKIVKENIQEAVSVKKQKLSWGTMMTVHHGSDTSYPLHPEHQSAIKKLKPGEKTSFKDETNSSVHAERDGDTVHLTRPKTSSTKTSVAHSHFTEGYMQEAVTVKKNNYSWGKMMTVHHGSDTSYPLHPEHQQAIAKLGDGEKTLFKDETNSIVHAHRDGDTVHLTRPKTSYTKTSVAHSHFTEEVKQGVAEETLSELKKSTLGSYAKKAKGEMGLSAMAAGAQSARGDAVGRAIDMAHAKKRSKGLDRAITRLTKEENMVETKGVLTHRIGLTVSDPNHPMVSKRGETYQKSVRVSGPNRKAAISQAIAHHRRKGYKVFDHHYFGTVEEENMVETKGAPKGFHFTKDGKLKRGDANQDGNGGPMLRTDPLDKQRSKVPAVSEKVEQITSKDIKMAVGVAKDKRYAGGNMSGAVKTMEKMKPGLSKHPRVQQVLKSTNEEETEQIDEKLTFKDIKMAVGVAKDKRYAGGNMSGAVKTMEKMKPGLSKHPRVQQALKTSNEGLDFKKIWERIKPEEVVIEEEAFDPVAHKKEHDRLMGKHIEAHKAVSKAFSDMKAQGKSPRFDIPENDKLNDIKQEIATHNAKIPRGPAPAPGSAAHYYASKKPGEYTGD